MIQEDKNQIDTYRRKLLGGGAAVAATIFYTSARLSERPDYQGRGAVDIRGVQSGQQSAHAVGEDIRLGCRDLPGGGHCSRCTRRRADRPAQCRTPVPVYVNTQSVMTRA